jgi:hypothetical protein
MRYMLRRLALRKASIIIAMPKETTKHASKFYVSTGMVYVIILVLWRTSSLVKDFSSTGILEKHSMCIIQCGLGSRTSLFTNKFSEQKTSRMTNGFSDYEHASWQQR